MLISDLCTKPVVTLARNAPVQQAAQFMTEKGVGSVVIVESQRPVGILTDRDIVIKVVAKRMNLETTIVGQVMSTNLLILVTSQGLRQAIHCMDEKGVRRAPVVDEHQVLYGIVSLDDLLRMLSQCLGQLTELIEKQTAQDGRPGG